jgi:hypothetical protein
MNYSDDATKVDMSYPISVNDIEDIHHTRIAITAYYKAEKRNFTPGHELNDWLIAEKECDVFRYI